MTPYDQLYRMLSNGGGVTPPSPPPPPWWQRAQTFLANTFPTPWDMYRTAMNTQIDPVNRQAYGLRPEPATNPVPMPPLGQFGGGRMNQGTTGSYRHQDETAFQSWYAELVQRRAAMGRPLGTDPYDPRQNYDFYQLWKSGWTPPANWENMGPDSGHFPSPFKTDQNNHVIVRGIDTRTGQQVAAPSYTGPYMIGMPSPEGAPAPVRGVSMPEEITP